MRLLFSDLFGFVRNPLNYTLDLAERSEPGLVPLELRPDRIYLVTDPALAKTILSSPTDQFDKGRYVRKLRPLVGDSSIILTGSEHQKRREAWSPHLTNDAIRSAMGSISSTIDETVDHLARRDSFDLYRETSPLAIKIVCSVLFGRAVLDTDDEEALLNALHRVETEVEREIYQILPLSPWARRKRAHRIAEGRARMSTVVKKLEGLTGEGTGLDILKELGLSQQQILDELTGLLLAGHHTTASVGAWLLYHLAEDHALADEVRSEAVALENATKGNRVEMLRRAKISLSVVKEVLRLYPPVYWFSREVKKPVELGGKNLEPGQTLVVSPWVLHRNRHHWQNPERFDRTRNHASPSFIPFGYGLRACVGMALAMQELQLLAMAFVRNGKLELVSPVPIAQPRASVMLVPPRFKMRLTEHTEPATGEPMATAPGSN